MPVCLRRCCLFAGDSLPARRKSSLVWGRDRPVTSGCVLWQRQQGDQPGESAGHQPWSSRRRLACASGAPQQAGTRGREPGCRRPAAVPGAASAVRRGAQPRRCDLRHGVCRHHNCVQALRSAARLGDHLRHTSRRRVHSTLISRLRTCDLTLPPLYNPSLPLQFGRSSCPPC